MLNTDSNEGEACGGGNQGGGDPLATAANAEGEYT
jgi:hypothetical protein